MISPTIVMHRAKGQSECILKHTAPSVCFVACGTFLKERARAMVDGKDLILGDVVFIILFFCWVIFQKSAKQLSQTTGGPPKH